MPSYWLLTIALRSLLRHGRMHLISSIAIVTGMSIFILGTSLINGLDEQTIRAQENVIGGEIIFHSSVEGKDHQARVLQPIEPALQERLQAPEIEAWTARTIFFARLFTKGNQRLTQVNGYNPETDSLVFPRDNWIIEGIEPTQPQEIGVGAILAQKLDIKLGDTLVLEARTEEGAINAIEYLCSGIIKTQVLEMDMSMLWLPQNSADELLQTKARYSQISVQLRGSREKAKPFVSQQEFSHWHGYTAKEEAQNRLSINQFRRKAISFVSIILLLIAALGLNNTMMMLCFKRKKEAGVLRAIGISPRQILALFSLEGLLLGFFSGSLACIMGGGLSYYLSLQGLRLENISAQTTTIPSIIYTQFSIPLLISTCVLASAFSLFASILPILFLLRQTPSQLLKIE